MESKTIKVHCECDGTGYIAVADCDGAGIDYIECAAHHPSFEGALSADELINHFGSVTGLTL